MVVKYWLSQRPSPLSTPFWEFHDLEGFTKSTGWLYPNDLSTPFWEFPVRVLFKIFLSFSLKAFMKLIGTFVIS